MATKIMLVDDNSDILAVLKGGMSIYEVTAFSDPRAAHNAFKNNPKEYSVLISDIRMPGMTGFELAREAKKLNPDVKVVLMSSFDIGLTEFENIFPSTRIDGTLTKPFRLATLQSTISKLINKLPNHSTHRGTYQNE